MNILFTTDGSKNSEKAAGFTASLFHEIKPHVTVVHIHPVRHARETKTQAQSYLDTAEKIFERYGMTAKKLLFEGNISEEILKEAQKSEYHLLVLGSQSQSSSVLETVASSLLNPSEEAIVKNTTASLLIVRNPPENINSVLACMDGSTYAEEAITFFARLGKKKKPKVTIFNILANPFPRFNVELLPFKKQLLDSYAKSTASSIGAAANRGKNILETYGIHDIRIKIREGEYAASYILKQAKKGNYDLIVMGYRGEKKHPHLGSQSLQVAEHAPTSVLIYLPQKTK